MGKRHRVSPAEFVQAWESSDCVNEVVEKLKIIKSLIMVRACYYRKRGVKLKHMRKTGTRHLDVAALNEIIKGIRGKLASDPV